MVQQYNVLGFRSHDARLAAFTIALGAKGLMSYNEKHPKKFPITLINPDFV